MKKYDYYTAMYDDIADYIKNNNINLSKYGDDIEDITEKLSDELWGEDSITGNGGFGYDTISNCEEYLCHNLDILFEAINDFDFDTNYYHLDRESLPKTLDSLIRCYILNSTVYAYVKDSLEENKND